MDPEKSLILILYKFFLLSATDSKLYMLELKPEIKTINF